MNNELTLLYVEDNEIVKENFTVIFSKYFANVITTDNGRDALALYEEHNIDIAILDISIPEIDGLSVAKILREKDKNIEIIMLTGHSEKEKLLQAIHLQLFSYLVKPVKRDELIDSLTRVIKKITSKNSFTLAYNYSYNTHVEELTYLNETVKLSKNEKKLLSFLCANPSSHFSACDISSVVFGVTNDEDIICNNVIQLISRFKKKMLHSYNKESFFIENIYGLGYKINT